ncbi:MAG: hypothetical protein ABIJ91_05115 [Candidatus Kuenenbacteria bacterium]
MNHLQKSILFTLSYFDLFVYPLTDDEIYLWLFDISGADKSSRLDIYEELDILVGEKKIKRKDGYYFLPGKQDTVATRQKREKISLKKIIKARRIARLLGFIPGLKMIAICSNLGYLNAEENADIDFFIIAQTGKIWTVRFWSAFLMKILRQRPTRQKTKNKICLSYYVADNNLNLEHTKISHTDIHLIYITSQYLPIYDEDNTWQKYMEENKWINNYLPNFNYLPDVKKYIIKPRLLWLKKKVSLTITPLEENFYKKIQLKIMPKELKLASQKNDKKVIVNNNMLKLHLNDKREEYNGKIFNSQFLIFKQ